jgi:multiple sugar transport system ATP-binding protein
VALGRAIVRQPKLFLMDEPLSNLDAQLRIQMRREIIHLQRQLNITTVYVTHDQVEAMTMGHRIVVMRDGLVQQVGNPVTIYSHPANRFVARFIGSPPMNMFDGTLESKDGALYLQTGFARFTLAPEQRARLLANPKVGGGRAEVTCGIRSEEIRLHPVAGAGAVQGIVDLVEPLGSDNYVSVLLGQDLLLARARPEETVQEAAPVRVELDLAHLHLFDRESGDNLLPPP